MDGGDTRWLCPGRRRSSGNRSNASATLPLVAASTRPSRNASAKARVAKSTQSDGGGGCGEQRCWFRSIVLLMLVTGAAFVLFAHPLPCDHLGQHLASSSSSWDYCQGFLMKRQTNRHNIVNDDAMHGQHNDHHHQRHPLLPATILVINLARRQDRWRRFSTHLRQSHPGLLANCQVERIEAVDGHDPDALVQMFPQMVVDGRLSQRAYESVMASRGNHARRVWGQEMTAGAVGCLLSHSKAWQRAVQLNTSVLVLEDDVELVSSKFADDLALAMNELPKAFGLLYLGDMARDTETIRKTDYSARLQLLSRSLWGTYAYVVSPQAARRLLLHMYPAEMQVDSYIKQVADLYDEEEEDDYLPNFVLAQDAVYTDNSETRDTDAQVIGQGKQELQQWHQQQQQHQPQKLEYHFLLPQVEEDKGDDNNDDDNGHGNAVGLWFDQAYSAAVSSNGVKLPAAAPPTISYHTESTAIAMAHEQNFLTPRQLAWLRETAAATTRRWIMCLAIATKRGGLCFTEPYTIVRSIEHLLDGAATLGLFMASSSTSPSSAASRLGVTQDVAVLPNIVFCSRSESSSKDHDALKCKLALAVDQAISDGPEPCISSSTACSSDHETQAMLHRMLTHDVINHRQKKQMVHMSLFHPQLFDPLLPLRRPCRCEILTDHGCQSRCDRMVAPPYAAGFAQHRARSVHSSLPARYLLHMVTPPRPLPSTQSATTIPTTTMSQQSNSGPWKRMNAAWAIRHIGDDKSNADKTLTNCIERTPHDDNLATTTTTTTPSKPIAAASTNHYHQPFLADIDSFCRGVHAVAAYGGAYVADIGLMPRRPLLHGVLSDWRVSTSMPMHHNDDKRNDGPHSARLTVNHSTPDDVSSSPSVVALWEENSVTDDNGAIVNFPKQQHHQHSKTHRILPSDPLHMRNAAARGTGDKQHNAAPPRHRRNTKRQLSWRFFAAATPGHPVAVRISQACTRLAEVVANSTLVHDENDDNNKNNHQYPRDRSLIHATQQQQKHHQQQHRRFMSQLTRALTDDASAVQFYSEREVFM